MTEELKMSHVLLLRESSKWENSAKLGYNRLVTTPELTKGVRKYSATQGQKKRDVLNHQHAVTTTATQQQIILQICQICCKYCRYCSNTSAIYRLCSIFLEVLQNCEASVWF